MMMDSTSLTIPVPNVIKSSPSGGRFDFDDGGTYCGGWQDGKAHGHGVCTGPKNVGEYSGSWNFGFEMSGVYRWKNGAIYEGRWQNGKRHGVGVEYNGKWIYKGEWSQGFKGRYGVKASSNSAVKYEGTWANGLQDGYGSETYSDGGYYQGQMCRGLRHGYGVRKSAPYGDSQLNNPNKNGQLTSTGVSSSMLIHSNSLQSQNSVDLEDDSPKPEDGFKPNIDRTLASKNGFVLVAKPLDVPIAASSKHNNNSNNNINGDISKSGNNRRNSLTNKLVSARIPGSNQTASILRGLRLRKQKSTSDLDAISGRQTPGANGGFRNRNTGQVYDNLDNHDLPAVPFTLSPEELDITDPTTVETYTGEWKHDKRNGHGVCDRSDGLKYEGQWHNDMKSGYGVTTFKDGSKEEGKYKNNILIVDSKVKRFFHLGSSNIRQRIDEAVKMAQQAQTMALKKAEIADTRAATARDKADQASTAALEADRDSQIAFSVARQYSDSAQQQQFQMASNPSFQSQQVEPLLPNFGSTPSSLQMRRISQQQQQPMNQLQMQQLMNQRDGQQVENMMNSDRQQQQMDMNNHLHRQQQPMQLMGHQANKWQQQNQQQEQQQQQQQYLAMGPVEPFNGRRGSFRGSSQSTSGYHSSFAPRSNQFGVQSNRQSADPFNDLFDHYKSTATSNYPGSNANRRMITKQTSLDYNSMRASMPRQMGPGNNERLTRFRMSSVEHAEENGRQQDISPSSLRKQANLRGLHQPQFSQDENSNKNSSSEQQFKHLVTSGEDLQQQQQDGLKDTATSGLQEQLMDRVTPTGSSYILPHSTNSSFAGNQTPSPDGGQNLLNRSPSSNQFYTHHQSQIAPSGYSHQHQHHHQIFQPSYQSHMKQRDVHSLADEQLYMANRRAQEISPIDRTEYTNYDFTISSLPRPARRCMRRTASLSRETKLSLEGGSHSAMGKTGSTLVGSTSGSNKWLNRQMQNNSPAISSLGDSPAKLHSEQHQQPALSIRVTGPTMNSIDQQPTNLSTDDTSPIANHIGGANLSQMTLDSSASSGILYRKPSLQVRYDPADIGGLMSREEVAALSHAQREQKRLEAEMAEKRAKRPILHLCLSLKEFLTRQRLLLTVLLVNALLFKMFADLIV